MDSTVWVEASCSHLVEPLQHRIRNALVRSVDVSRLIQNGGLAVGESPHVLMIGPGTGYPDSTAQVVRSVRTRSASTTIFVCSGLDARVVNQMPELARAGADDLFTIGSRSDLERLANQIQLRLLAPVPSLALDLMRERLPGNPIREVASMPSGTATGLGTNPGSRGSAQSPSRD